MNKEKKKQKQWEKITIKCRFLKSTLASKKNVVQPYTHTFTQSLTIYQVPTICLFSGPCAC
jgi:uncharacterized membrane protein